MYKKWTVFIAIVIVATLLAGCPSPGGPTPLPATATAGPAPSEPTTTAAPATSAPTTAAPATAAPEVTAEATGAASPAPAGTPTLTVMTHDSFSASENVIAAFQAQCKCKVQFLKSGDAGLALNKAILSKDNPLADAFYGVDNTFLTRALKAGIFEPYASPALAQIPDDLKLDPSNSLLPVDFGYVTLNYDKGYFKENQLTLPTSLKDLAAPAYKSMLVVENPATSSPGLAFLLTTIAAFGETGSYTYLNFWKDLRANDVLVSEGWDDAYNNQFSAGGGDGDRPLVVSYGTSPAAGVYFASPQPAEAPTGNLFFPKGSFRQVEFVGVLKGAKQPDLARQWVDFMLSDAFQADIPLQMWVYPARQGTALPDVFTKFSQVPPDAVSMTPEQIDAGRDKWLSEWTNTVLR